MRKGPNWAQAARNVAGAIAALFVLALVPPAWFALLVQWASLLLAIGGLTIASTVWWAVHYLVLIVATKSLYRESKEATTRSKRKLLRLAVLIRRFWRRARSWRRK